MPMVVRITGLGRSTIYRLIAEKTFPGPVRVGDRAVAVPKGQPTGWAARSRPTVLDVAEGSSSGSSGTGVQRERPESV